MRQFSTGIDGPGRHGREHDHQHAETERATQLMGHVDQARGEQPCVADASAQSRIGMAMRPSQRNISRKRVESYFRRFTITKLGVKRLIQRQVKIDN